MCGRYYVDDEVINEINKIVQNIQTQLTSSSYGKEVYPTNQAPVLVPNNNNSFDVATPSWGFPHWDKTKKSVLINARAETALQKKMFKDSLLNRRCIIPAAGFYEWDKTKNKIAFTNGPILYMAGFYKSYNSETRFIVLTTNANISVQDVHSRMPLVLDKAELENWLYDNNSIDFILNKTPAPLSRNIVVASSS